MSHITESNTWESVYKIETTDPVQGGLETSKSNLPHKNLTFRTAYLKNVIENIIAGVTGIVGKLLNGSTVANAYAGGQQNDTAVASAGFVQSAISKRPGRRNVLLNGDMRIYQRGESFTLGSAGKYMTLDRWLVELGGSRTAEVGIDRNLHRSDVPGASHAFRLKPNAASGLFALRQRVENAWLLEGGACSVQFCASSGIAFDVTIRVAQYINATQLAAGTPQASITATLNIAAGFGWYSTILQVPRLNTLDLSGIDEDNCIEVSIETTDNRSNDWWITNIQCEKGEIASDFELRDDWNECLRYFEKHEYFERYDDAQNVADGASRYSVFRRQYYHHKRKIPHVEVSDVTYLFLDAVSTITQPLLNACTLQIRPTSTNYNNPTTRTIEFTLEIDAEL